MKEKIVSRMKEHSDAMNRLLEDSGLIDRIECIAKTIIESYKRGGKLVAFGNGGSAADAQHIVGELVNKFYFERPMLNAFALNTNTSVITAIGNDFSYDEVFSRQIENLVDDKDVVIGISTSGNSANVIKALQVARNRGAVAVGFTGSAGGRMKECVDILVNVPSSDTPRVQEMHITIGHIICEIVEQKIFGK